MSEFVLKEISLLNSYTIGDLIKELAMFYANLLVKPEPLFSSTYMPQEFDEYVRTLSIEEVARLIKDILDWVHKK